MDKDKLIKEAERMWHEYCGHLNDDNFHWSFYWLIEQAKRVQELELEIDDWREEVRKWQQFYEESEESHSETIELLHSTASVIKHYREALEFYANRENYKPDHYDHDIHEYISMIDYDNGATARKALEGENNEW